MIEWEVKVAAYEVASGDRTSEAVRVATIMDHAPDVVKSMLRLSLLEQRRSVDALKLWIRESSYATPGLFQGSMPMQAGAVSDGGKGKNGKSKSTGDKGKGKTRAVMEIRPRDGTTGTVVSNKRNSRATVHIARSGATNAQNRKLVQWLAFKSLNLKLAVLRQQKRSDADSDGADLDTSSWCFAALNNPRSPAGTLLVDSGADDHMCHPDFAKEFPLKKSMGLTLSDVQGIPLSHHGTRHVNLSVVTGGQRANIDFQIADISDNILSLGKLLRNGFVFNLRRETDSIMYHQRKPTTNVPLFLHKNSLRIRASPIVYHVSPVMEEDMPVRLSAQSPFRLLDRRLDELALPKHGTKLDKWTRL